MKIALIGASGFVGSAILKEALERGHVVTAIVRHPEKIKNEDDKVTKIKANALNADEVAEAVKGNDIVINAYNPGWTNPRIYDEFIEGFEAIRKGTKKAGIKRLFIVGGGGSLYIAPDVQLVDTPEFPQEYKQGALALRDYLKTIKQEKDLEWTFLSPAIEMHQGTSGQKKGTYRKGLDQPVFNESGRSIISVEDMAAAILDEAEKPEHLRQRFTVGY